MSDFSSAFNFNPLTPHRGKTTVKPSLLMTILQFQSARPARGETKVCVGIRFHAAISIHSPHTGRDSHSSKNAPLRYGFQSTHPVRGETSFPDYTIPTISLFQSTRPVRGETQHTRIRCAPGGLYFNPLTPCGVRLTRTGTPLSLTPTNFNPLTPYGVRQQK